MPRFPLGSGANSLFNANGSAILIFAAPYTHRAKPDANACIARGAIAK